MNRAEVFALLKGTEWGDMIYNKLRDKKQGKVDSIESILINTMNEWFNRDKKIPYNVLMKYSTFVAAVAAEYNNIGISNNVAKRMMIKMTNCFDSQNKIDITQTSDNTFEITKYETITKFIE